MPYTDPTAFTSDNRTSLGAGVWPERRDTLPRHFQIIGVNDRTLVISDMHGLIDLGGVHVKDPEHLDEMAERLRALAEAMRERGN